MVAVVRKDDDDETAEDRTVTITARLVAAVAAPRKHSTGRVRIIERKNQCIESIVTILLLMVSSS